MTRREPGSNAAIDAVLDVFESFDSRDDITAHLNYEEADPIAYLAYFQGRRALAQSIMLDWANNDPDAHEHREHLATWGIESSALDAEDWRITTLNINPEEKP